MHSEISLFNLVLNNFKKKKNVIYSQNFKIPSVVEKLLILMAFYKTL